MKILVTGGCGFIGSNFIRYVLDTFKNHEVINVDNLTYAGNEYNLEDIKKKYSARYTFYRQDINSELMKKWIKDVDVVINFAAETHVDRSIEDSSAFFTTNINGTINLLNAAKDLDKEYIQISTDEVYGELGETGLFTEESPIKPSSPYSASKAAADLIALSYYKTHGTKVKITRCSNNYGPYQHTEKLIPLLIKNSLFGEDLPIYGNGENVRDWIYVLDHCKAIYTVMTKGAFGEVYNIGGNCERKNIHIARKILSLIPESKSRVVSVEDRKGHDYRYAIDNTKIKLELQWSPKTAFVEGLRDTIDWYRKNMPWEAC